MSKHAIIAATTGLIALLSPGWSRGQSPAVATEAAAATPAAAAVPGLYTIGATATTTSPASPLLYGNFIELGFGRQVDGLWAEMLYNRSFEEDPSSRPGGTWDWLRREPGTILTNEVWWHSGYRRDPWETLGEPGKFTANLGSRYWMRHGFQQAMIKNDGQFPARLFQRGIQLRSNTAYRVRAQVRSGGIGTFTGPEFDLTAGFMIESSGWRPLTEATARVGGEWQTFEVELNSGTFEGEALFVISVPQGNTLNIDAVSLMPVDNEAGWRKEAVEALRRVKPGILRFPGGCFASTYNWRDAIGPALEHIPRVSPAWNDLENNDVGTAEFVKLCQLVGAEPLLCVNLMNGRAEDAADWVAYCNASTNHPLGALRARHGHPAPFGVKFWELDNEGFRKYSPSQYASRAAEFSRAMKAVDPGIKTVLCAYWDPVPGFRNELAGMLEVAGDTVDLVARREFADGLRETLALVRDYNARTGHKLKLCNTEWFPHGRQAPFLDDGAGREPTDSEKTFQNQQVRWQWGLNTAATLMEFRELGGDLAFSCFNNLANTWGQNALECAREGVWLSAAGRVLELLAASPGRWPVGVTGGTTPGVRVWAALSADGKALEIDVVNDQDVATGVTLAPPETFAGARNLHVTTLAAASAAARNTLANPNAVVRTGGDEEVVRLPFRFDAPPHSFSTLVLTP